MEAAIDWNKFAQLRAGEAAPHFGNPRVEFEAARASAVLTPVTQFALLRVHGADAQAFLQGQLTCDMEEVKAERAQFGGYCNPKGRLLANFLLLTGPSDYLMQLPADIADDIVIRLRRFVLRSRVTIEREDGWGMLGVAGPEGAAAIEGELGVLPSGRLAVRGQGSAMIVGLPRSHFLLLAPGRDMPGLWAGLARRALPAGAQCWSWVQVHAAIPWITATSQEQFLPQMIGLDAMGGVSFGKGCFPGQEIVARSRYLGEVKRKLRLGHTQGTLRPGDAIFLDRQQAAVVLNAAPLPEGGSDFLAVAAEQADDRPWTTADGEAITWSVAARDS